MPRPLSPLHVGLGRAILKRRTKQGLSQEALGYAAGLHRNYIGGVERGELNPALTNLAKIAAALDLLPSRLLALAEGEEGAVND